MRTRLALVLLVALSSTSFGKDIRRGNIMQVKANSVWFQDEANLTHWQQLKKSGDTAALASFQEQVLSQRDAWQFVTPLTVKILRYEIRKRQVKVEMTSPGRML